MKKIWMYIRWPYDWLVFEIRWRKREKMMRREDPFIYEADE